MLANAQEIGSKVSRRFLQTPRLFYDNTIHYAEVCTWYAALRFASMTQDADLAEKLINRFEPLFGSEKSFLPGKNHVDFNMFGCLPLK
ncbi:MAG: hypothetical protein LBG87_06255, partial [Spirochaetaceae bacterium]|nr:hypothetical protein [Spirochaetaceae bacterium]